MKRKIFGSLLSFAVICVFTAVAAAGTIPATPGVWGDGSGNHLGESDLQSSTDPAKSSPQVDWIVVQASLASKGGAFDTSGWLGLGVTDGHYVYLYSAENSSTSTMSSLSIGVPLGSVVKGDAGTYGGYTHPGPGFGDLDAVELTYHPAHTTFPDQEGPNPDDVHFGNLTGHCDDDVPGHGGGPGDYCLVEGDGITAVVNPTGVNWNFSPNKPSGHETIVLWYSSLLPPTYGNATLNDTDHNWSTLQINSGVQGQKVPVPGPLQTDIPEPTTFLLFGSGLVTLGLLRRKMKR